MLQLTDRIYTEELLQMPFSLMRKPMYLIVRILFTDRKELAVIVNRKGETSHV